LTCLKILAPGFRPTRGAREKPVPGHEIKHSPHEARIDTDDRGELGYRVFRMKTAIVGARAASPVNIRRVT